MVKEDPKPHPMPEHDSRRGATGRDALEERLRRTEAELERIYGSAEWRRLHRWRRLEVEANVWRHRLLHPVDFARAMASRFLPVGWRLALLRIFQKRRRGRRGPGIGGRPASSSQAAVAQTAPGPKPTIICLPVIEWSFRRQRPQQLLERLAAAGWPVLYASLDFDRGSRKEQADREEWAPGVHAFTLPAARELKAGSEPLGVDDIRLMARALAEFREREDITTAIVLCHSPFWFPLARVLHQAFGWPLVYDRMDLHEGFESAYPGIGDDDQRLQAEADLVLASSRVLAAESSKHATRVVHLPNGCDWETWGSAEPSSRLEKLPRPIIGYYGAISSWFDTELVVSLALARPAWSFVLIGSTWDGDTSRLEQLPNVHLLGERPYEELPGLAAAFDVGIIPFRRTTLTEATDPVKLYEMLALGLDVVTPPLASLDAFEGLIRIADGPEAFLTVLEDLLRRPTPPEEVERRRAFARASSWEERAARMEEELRELFPLVSIGIVTFHNRELTELCLESIRRSTIYPNYEIVVVDNASTDGTREWLEELARDWPRLRIIANDTNLGFAAACNQAFAEAQGEILCFLNNDTVVTRGWLTAMVQYLQEHPETGMVGPVSNGVANAARVEPGYTDLADLEEWAAAWTRKHRGESFPIPMLALYCAAIRRDTWERVGPLDEAFATGMFEDDDYSKRLRRAGYELRCLRDAWVHHWHQASFGALPSDEYLRIYEENRRRFLEKRRRRGRSPEAAGSPAETVADSAAAETGAAPTPAPPPVAAHPIGTSRSATDLEGLETGDTAAAEELPVYDSAATELSPFENSLRELLAYKDLLRLLVGTNIKTRYKRSFLGVIWTLLNPLATTIVMTVAFSALFRFSMQHYAVYVLSGLLFWSYFQQSSTQSMSSVVWGASLLKKVYVPATVFPLAAVGTGLVNLLLSVPPLFLIMLILGHPFTPALLFLPVAVLLVTGFTLGLGLLLASYAVFFTDVVEMYVVILRIWFYLTPVMYPKRILPERMQPLIMMNPMYHMVLCWREPIFNGVLPPTSSILAATIWSAGTLVLGWWIFSRRSHEFALRA